MPAPWMGYGILLCVTAGIAAVLIAGSSSWPAFPPTFRKTSMPQPPPGTALCSLLKQLHKLGIQEAIEASFIVFPWRCTADSGQILHGGKPRC
ncbi:uncharacterized protein BO72DRAFT_219216 [Aspergillus fijiensis CBS 313.89]|uniref:Secreted protein n=1 Tax=Aspergillus fijiensis CBS 313.89 TaxID=1448319 RepID=A0A8G1VWB4_9EURO|nr:uncharacterized protein BO72DRAFT_219216 [Aspergillus fijiensis CBS 313.89]RAK74011.1 hypothetical protein BO72DRAFT_219216 [Aspergillus fijiensis CBS 313.89]